MDPARHPLPRSLLPRLPAVAEEAFDSPDHLFELRWGGIRALAFVEPGRLTLRSQSGRDITAWFPELAALPKQVRRPPAVLDGEIVALDGDGLPRLSLLADRLARPPASGGPVACVFQAYDVLNASDLSLLDRPLISRKERLQRLLGGPGPAMIAEYIESDGVAYFEAVASRRLPGMVAKRKDSRYRAGQRSADWQEVRVYESGWFVVGGYTVGLGNEGPLASLLLGVPTTGGRLRYVGQVRTTEQASLEETLSVLGGEDCPFSQPPPVARLVYWLRPELVCEANYARIERDGRLRFPVLISMRPDLSADACVVSGTGGASRVSS